MSLCVQMKKEDEQLKARREIVKGQKNNNNNKKKLPQEIERSQEINGGLELTGETPSEVDDLGDLQTKTKETKHFDFGDCRELMMCLLQHIKPDRQHHQHFKDSIGRRQTRGLLFGIKDQQVGAAHQKMARSILLVLFALFAVALANTRHTTTHRPPVAVLKQYLLTTTGSCVGHGHGQPSSVSQSVALALAAADPMENLHRVH
ncbi:hypothetical protein TYRP_018218 [Tyrophagus putrescentiae]|nr:hypothetical protein TYRP_018218 [Tyrophagus putrescentiae]